MVFVPFVPVLLLPCAKLPNSFPNAVVHMSQVAGSFANVLYFVMVTPVVGWTTPAPAKYSRSGIGVVSNAVGSYCVESSVNTLWVMNLIASCEMM